VSDRGATVLETERLVLRHLTLGDLDELAALYRDPEVRRYFPEGTLTYEETREELEWCIDVYDGRYLLRRRRSGSRPPPAAPCGEPWPGR
jgi:RimJ/RimL family protein N-acetyltransferase